MVLLLAIVLSISASKHLHFTLAVLCVGPQVGVLEKQLLRFPVAVFYGFITIFIIIIK